MKGLIKDINSVIGKVSGDKRYGINYPIQDHFQKIEQWLSFYRGNINNFQLYWKRVNGKTKEFFRPSLQLGKQVVEERRKLIFSESFEILTKKNQKKLNEVLEYNNFYHKFPEFWEKVAAYCGYGILVEFEDEYGKLNIDMIDGRNSFIIHSNSNRISGVLTLSQYRDVVNSVEVVYKLLTFHYQEGDDYKVVNKLYRSLSANRLGQEVSLDDFEDTRGMAEEVLYKNIQPRFQVIFPSGTNNHDVDAIYPVPILANCGDIIKNCDKIAESIMHEIDAKKARILVARNAMKATVDSNTGGMVEYFDQDEMVYQGIGLDASSMKDPVKEINMGEFRITELEKGFELMLNELSKATGLGQGHFSSKINSSRVTATAVISEKSGAYASKMADEVIIRKELIKMVKAIGDMLNVDFGEVEIAFNDAILETEQQKQEKLRFLAEKQMIPKWYVLSKVLKINEQDAKALVKDAANEMIELTPEVEDTNDKEFKEKNTAGAGTAGVITDPR